jgi:hypothetical protein
MPKMAPITASVSLDKLITVKLKSIPGKEILSGFERAIDRASAKIAIDLKAALDEAMRSDIWPTTGGGADIIASGELLESGRVIIGDSGVSVVYDAPYAALVHYGGYISPYGNASAKVYLPARPWVEAVLLGGYGIPAFNFIKYYEDEIIKEFR